MYFIRMKEEDNRINLIPTILFMLLVNCSLSFNSFIVCNVVRLNGNYVWSTNVIQFMTQLSALWHFFCVCCNYCAGYSVLCVCVDFHTWREAFALQACARIMTIQTRSWAIVNETTIINEKSYSMSWHSTSSFILLQYFL